MTNSHYVEVVRAEKINVCGTILRLGIALLVGAAQRGLARRTQGSRAAREFAARRTAACPASPRCAGNDRRRAASLRDAGARSHGAARANGGGGARRRPQG